MIICSLLFWILVSSRTFHKLIICTVSLILEMYWLGYVTFTFRNINIVSISLLEGSSLSFQHTCIKHGNAEVPRILGFAIECFTDWLKTLLTRLYRAWGSFGVLPLWRRIHTKVTVIFPLLSVTFPRWLFPFLSKQRSFSVEGITLHFLLYNTKMLVFQIAIDEMVIDHIFRTFHPRSILQYTREVSVAYFKITPLRNSCFSTKRRLEPIACLLIRLANQTIKFSSAC